DNHDALLGATVGKTKAEIQQLVAAQFPRPDAPSFLEPRPLALPRAHTAAPAAVTTPTPSPERAVVEPLSPERSRAQSTASTELRDKLAHARDLLAHQIPNGDLSAIVERAVDLLLEKLERQRLGKSKRPRATKGGVTRAGSAPRTSKRPGYVSRAVRRE